MDAHVRAHQVEQAWYDIELDVEVVELACRGEEVGRALVAGGDDDALDPKRLDDLAQPVGRPEDGEVLGQVVAPHLGAAVDEADDVEAVLRMLEELAGDQLADVAGAEDERVL